MPTVNVDCETLYHQMGKTFTDQQFEDLCFDFGIELEEVTFDEVIKTKKIYKIDIPANRYDMLCVEGISRALKTYLELGQPPIYKTTLPVLEMIVEPETSLVRPFVVCAVLRNVQFNEQNYNSFIDLQEKLHNNLCRKRTLVAIGTHDLDTLKPPFRYRALEPKSIQFVPLNQTKSMNAEELMTFYESDRKLSKFLDIIRSKPVYPVIYDSNQNVLSLPPIINSDHSKIKLTTKNVFIECTATDKHKAQTVLQTMVTMFSQYCKEQFTVEQVKITYPDSQTVTPTLEDRQMNARTEYINTAVGIQETPESLVRLLQKMSLKASLTPEKDLLVKIPPTRSDILHECDIMEDCAIAYNFNKIIETVPKAYTIAVPLPINKLGDSMRKEIALAGYTEVLAFTLCSKDENFAFLNKKDNKEAVVLANPKTIEYQVVRTSLMPGILKTVSSNKAMPLPLKVFEVSDIVLRDESLERRARNQRNVCCLYSNKTAGFEHIHGLVDRLMMMLSVPRGENGYVIKPSEDDLFFPGRRADLIYKGNKVGHFGIVHPLVLEKFDISVPCSALEFNLEPFL
ncbi:hypothetical protein EDD86DRAFT_270446 [Gorgonomyces haynaldii]|nr:hypothetical protein EDD86DRAFT_270446 [Gorgonomyces haynaldii]